MGRKVVAGGLPGGVYQGFGAGGKNWDKIGVYQEGSTRGLVKGGVYRGSGEGSTGVYRQIPVRNRCRPLSIEGSRGLQADIRAESL